MAKQAKDAKTEVTPESASKQQARAVVYYQRISPRRVRLVINQIRHKPVPKAIYTLMAMKKKAARLTEKLLKSAVANAKVLGLEESKLVISDIRADGGPTLKRFRPRSMGRADRILKRTTHLTMVLKEGKRPYRGMGAPKPEQEEVKGKGSKTENKKARAASKNKAAAAK